MTDKQKLECNAIIHSASAAAAGVGAGLAQIPLSDNALITPIQIGMTISLGKVFDRRLSESAAASLTATAITGMTGRAIAQVLCGWIPGVGNAVNAGTAATVTETLGWTLARKFDREAA